MRPGEGGGRVTSKGYGGRRSVPFFSLLPSKDGTVRCQVPDDTRCGYIHISHSTSNTFKGAGGGGEGKGESDSGDFEGSGARFSNDWMQAITKRCMQSRFS